MTNEQRKDIEQLASVFSGEELYAMVQNAGIDVTNKEIDSIVAKPTKKAKPKAKKISGKQTQVYALDILQEMISEARHIKTPECQSLYEKMCRDRNCTQADC